MKRKLGIARELLAVEHERLGCDHYDDRVNTTCDGCKRRTLARLEIEFIDKLNKKEVAHDR